MDSKVDVRVRGEGLEAGLQRGQDPRCPEPGAGACARLTGGLGQGGRTRFSAPAGPNQAVRKDILMVKMRAWEEPVHLEKPRNRGTLARFALEKLTLLLSRGEEGRSGALRRLCGPRLCPWSICTGQQNTPRLCSVFLRHGCLWLKTVCEGLRMFSEEEPLSSSPGVVGINLCPGTIAR